MLLLENGLKLAQSEKEFTQWLFKKGGTCDAYLKRKNERLCHVHNAQGELVGAVVVPRGAIDAMIVTATKHDNGKIYYMYSTTKKTEEFLGMVGMGYMETISLANVLHTQAH